MSTEFGPLLKRAKRVDELSLISMQVPGNEAYAAVKRPSDRLGSM
jgi:hypothetical protein